MFDLHRHDEFSLFDGFGKARDIVDRAKELNYKALGLTNHGNTSGLVQHVSACREVDLKPILGVEGYFQPVLNKEKPRYHLCLIAKNLQGYKNINRICTIAEEQMYYKPIMTFKEIEEFSEGLIVSSACIGGPISQALAKGNKKMAIKLAKKFKNLFDDDFYIEIQPYKLSEKGLQEKVNCDLITLANKLDIKCILTSDSHYSRKEDWDSYLKMHEISSPEFDAEATYGERYMPSEDEIISRFTAMHGKTKYAIDYPLKFAQQCIKNLDEIADKCDDDILAQLPLLLPEFIQGKDSFKYLLEQVKDGLKRRGKYNKEYIQRCKDELEIIKYHGFADYFLIVSDYTKWAKEQGISVGPGRGSVCNCQVAWALFITEVDSLKFDLEFRRFLRMDKKRMPDIDLDFETSRRQEVIEYIVNKYRGHTAQIRSYGLYKVDNLINDLAKVCGLEDSSVIKELKKFVNQYVEDGSLNSKGIMEDKMYIHYNRQYDDILKHYIKMYKKIKYFGTHAAGVAISGGDIRDYTVLKVDKKSGKTYTCFDLADLEAIHVIKFDILGLSTMEQIGELKRLTGKHLNEDWFSDENILSEFNKGNTDGIFQFESGTAKQILQDIDCDCMGDIIAASSMNRPGPLSLGMPAQYAENKFNLDEVKNSKYFKYTSDSYGAVIYQEQIQQICIHIGKMEWADADKIMKMIKGGNMPEYALKLLEQNKQQMMDKFIKGATSNGLTREEAEDTFSKMLVYSFNKGHSTGYSIVSVEEMFYKVYYPTEFWYVKTKYAPSNEDRWKYSMNAILQGVLLFLPHVNYTADFSLRKVGNENVIQEGMSSIKFVGQKAAEFIEEERKRNGPYKSYDDFYDRCKNRSVTSRVIDVLKEQGALEFNKNIYIKRVTKYNATLYQKALQKK